jgi:hypothetical protein
MQIIRRLKNETRSNSEEDYYEFKCGICPTTVKIPINYHIGDKFNLIQEHINHHNSMSLSSFITKSLLLSIGESEIKL